MRCALRALFALLLVAGLLVVGAMLLWKALPRVGVDSERVERLTDAVLGSAGKLRLEEAAVGVDGAELLDVDLTLATGIRLQAPRIDLEGVDWAGLAERDHMSADELILHSPTLTFEIAGRHSPERDWNRVLDLLAEWGNVSLGRVEVTDATLVVTRDGEEVSRVEGGRLALESLGWSTDGGLGLRSLSGGVTGGEWELGRFRHGPVELIEDGRSVLLHDLRWATRLDAGSSLVGDVEQLRLGGVRSFLVREVEQLDGVAVGARVRVVEQPTDDLDLEPVLRHMPPLSVEVRGARFGWGDAADHAVRGVVHARVDDSGELSVCTVDRSSQSAAEELELRYDPAEGRATLRCLARGLGGPELRTLLSRGGAGVEVLAGRLHELTLEADSDGESATADAAVHYTGLELDVVDPTRSAATALLRGGVLPQRGAVGRPHRVQVELPVAADSTPLGRVLTVSALALARSAARSAE